MDRGVHIELTSAGCRVAGEQGLRRQDGCPAACAGHPGGDQEAVGRGTAVRQARQGAALSGSASRVESWNSRSSAGQAAVFEEEASLADGGMRPRARSRSCRARVQRSQSPSLTDSSEFGAGRSRIVRGGPGTYRRWRTVSIMRCTLSGLASGVMPWPRLKTCGPAWNAFRIERVSRMRASPPATR